MSLARKLTVLTMVGLFVPSVLASCAVRYQVPPGQIRRQATPGHMMRR